MNRCPKCGTEYDGNFCPNGCQTSGASTATKTAEQSQGMPTIVINNVNTNTNTNNNVNAGVGMGMGISPKSKWVAFVLCLILGIFGIHRFYVGKVGTGILYIFTGGLFGIGWLIDLINILCGNFRDNMGLFLKK